MLWNKIMLLAEVSTAGEASGDPAMNAANSANWLSSLSPIIMLAVFAAIFYFLLIRPEKKRKKQVQEQRDAMKVGDTVITIGGITGEIEKIRKETITVFTGNCSIDIQKWAIRSVEADELAEDAEDAPAEEATEESAKLNEEANAKGYEE